MGTIPNILSRTAETEEDLDIQNVEINMKWPYIVLIFINMLVILPISVHMTYNYYILRDSYMYNSRRPRLVIVFNIVAITFVGLYTPLHIIILEIYWQNNAKYEEWWDTAFFFTIRTCVFVAFAIRTWHSFYDFKLAHSISTIQWKSILNERYRNSKTNFFLKYHKTLGHPRKTFLYFLIIPATIFGIIFIVILIMEVGYNIEYVMLFISFIYLLISVGLLIYIITHTWRHVYDNIHLRGEILAGCVVLCIAVTLEAIIQAIDLMEYTVENEKYQQVFNFCFNVISCISCFALIIVSTQYVRIKVAQNEGIDKVPHTDDIEGDDGTETQWISQDEVDFQALISTRDGLKEFLEYLAKEYELNSLVFAMEVTQYKTYVIPKLIKKYKLFIQKLESSLLQFPHNMPQSSIVYPTKDSSERRMFMHIYARYIMDDAEWKIKISAQRMNETVTLYRRCQMARTNMFSIRGKSDDNDNDNDHASIKEEFQTESIQTLRPHGHGHTTNSIASRTAPVATKDLKAMVEALDGALNDVIETLKRSFSKYRQTEAFKAWFATIEAKDRDIITRNYRHRKLVEKTEIQKQNMTVCKEWRCEHCTLMNRAIHIDSRLRMPQSMCMCCGYEHTLKHVLLRTKTLTHYWRSTHRESALFHGLTPSNKHAHAKMDSADEESLGTESEFKDDQVQVQLDANIVTLWHDLLKEMEENKEDNTCEGVNSDYVDSCPMLQKLHFVMRCYNYYLGKQDTKGDTPCNYDIPSMAELVNHLEDLNLQKLLDIYQHVSTVHFDAPMFEYFADSLGKCEGGTHCKPLTRNNGKRIAIAMDNDTLNEEKEEEKYVAFRPLRRAATVCKDIHYEDTNGKAVNAEERITLSYLDKWHAFLFHPIANKHTLGKNGNKFVTDASKYGSLSKVMSTKMNLLTQSVKGKSYDDVDDIHDDIVDDDTYYEYGFGSQIEYHTLRNHFVCMKQELIGNDVYTVTDKVWDDTLAKALLFLDMNSVKANYRANDHGKAEEYGVKRGELIGVDHVIAILFYCNFDELQNEFSRTFRKHSAVLKKTKKKRQEAQEAQDVARAHCKNYYWFGRALYVAINFYGQRMHKNQVVWHGLSSKMLFENFAAHFDSPTSTTTQKNVAQTFSGNGSGIILQLKSKHNINCAWMLDVSLFSDYTDECERLFLNETLIITDILTIINNRWVSFKNYVGACLYFNKITTANANDATWNINETPQIQNVLVKVMQNFLMRDNTTDSNVPHYVRILFRHYCMKHTKPRFDDIDKVQHKMTNTLQSYLFHEIMTKDTKQKISEQKIKRLFPYAIQYMNDQKQLVSINETISIIGN